MGTALAERSTSVPIIITIRVLEPTTTIRLLEPTTTISVLEDTMTVTSIEAITRKVDA